MLAGGDRRWRPRDIDIEVAARSSIARLAVLHDDAEIGAEPGDPAEIASRLSPARL